jgi:hypothetical protein
VRAPVDVSRALRDRGLRVPGTQTGAPSPLQDVHSVARAAPNSWTPVSLVLRRGPVRACSRNQGEVQRCKRNRRAHEGSGPSVSTPLRRRPRRAAVGFVVHRARCPRVRGHRPQRAPPGGPDVPSAELGPSRNFLPRLQDSSKGLRKCPRRTCRRSVRPAVPVLPTGVLWISRIPPLLLKVQFIAITLVPALVFIFP